VNQFLLGAIATLCLVISLILLRSWLDARDRLFFLFALAFCVEGVNRAALATQPSPNEAEPAFYVIRLVSFLIILVAIVDRNLPGRRSR
jgi:uncharacterized membrane protein HdeD (DUF308 family)